MRNCCICCFRTRITRVLTNIFQEFFPIWNRWSSMKNATAQLQWEIWSISVSLFVLLRQSRSCSCRRAWGWLSRECERGSGLAFWNAATTTCRTISAAGSGSGRTSCRCSYSSATQNSLNCYNTTICSKMERTPPNCSAISSRKSRSFKRWSGKNCMAPNTQKVTINYRCCWCRRGISGTSFWKWFNWTSLTNLLMNGSGRSEVTTTATMRQWLSIWPGQLTTAMSLCARITVSLLERWARGRWLRWSILQGSATSPCCTATTR